MVQWHETHPFLFWLRKIGCPTTNCQKMAEHLVTKDTIPLGKYLLGAVYRLLHQVSIRVRQDKAIDNLGGSWWFIQIWLNSYMHRIARINLRSAEFPSSTFAEGEDFIARGASSIGEAASQMMNDPSVLNHTDYFKSFYQGFSPADFSWFIYTDVKDTFPNPIKFDLTDITSESTTKILSHALLLSFLRVDFTSIKDKMSYEFYHPSIVARQLGFGQVPIHLYLADVVKSRGTISRQLEFRRLIERIPSAETLELDNWIIVPFTSAPFNAWWDEWSIHPFHKSPTSHLKKMDADYPDDNSEVNQDEPPTKSVSGTSIDYAPPTDEPLIGRKAPSPQDIATGRAQRSPTIKVTSKKRKISATEGSSSSVSQNPKTKQSAKTKKLKISSSTADSSPRIPSIGITIRDVPPPEPEHTPADTSNIGIPEERTPATATTDAPPISNLQTIPEEGSDDDSTFLSQVIKSAKQASGSAERIQRTSTTPPTLTLEEPSAIIPQSAIGASSYDHPISAQPIRASEVQLKQAQDSPDHSLFDFPVSEFLEDEEETSSVMVPGQLSAEAKARLMKIQDLLNQDIIDLVQDAAPIREALTGLQGQLPQDLEVAILPVAYIEGHRPEVLKAKQQLEDRQTAEQTRQESLSARDEDNTIKGHIDLLQSSAPTISSKINSLKEKREVLKELELLEAEIASEEDNLRALPKTIENMKSALATQVRKAISLHKKIKDIPGSSSDDQKAIDEADGIRLCALKAVQNFLGSL